MANQAQKITPRTGADKDGARATGVLPSHVLRELIRSGEIGAEIEIAPEQVQPASLDLRLGARAYRVQASFLPGPDHDVAEKIDAFALHEFDLTHGAVLETGCVYVVPLIERLALSPRLSGKANPKSSIGRLDVFTRLITDRAGEFDAVAAGYRGPLYAEISPRSFAIVVRTGSRLNQLRIRRGSAATGEGALKRLHDEVGLVDRDLDGVNLASGVPLTVDLKGAAEWALAGYKARKNTGLIDVDRVGYYEPDEFWEPIGARPEAGIILNPDDFYILVSREAVTVPPDHAAEMVAYDTLVGEFRAHYAGFFDPGFGHADAGGAGTRAVLEVRSHDVPFVVEHGQLVGRLTYERLTDVPAKLYGEGIGSSYQRQGLALGKHFKRPGA